MQVEHVLGGVALLRVAQRRRPPVRALLALVELDAEELANQVLESVAVGVGPHQPRRDLGAVDRTAVDLEVPAEHREIEAGIVEQLQSPPVGKKTPQVGCRILAGWQLHEVGPAVAGGELHDAQSVAPWIETHGLGIDGHDVAEIQPGRQIAVMKGDIHLAPVAHHAEARPSMVNGVRKPVRAMVPRRGLEPPRPCER